MEMKLINAGEVVRAGCIMIWSFLLVACFSDRGEAKKRGYMTSYVAYIKTHPIDTSLCHHSFLDERLRSEAGRCAFFAQASSALKEMLSHASDWDTEVVSLKNSKYDFGEALTNEEVYYLKIITPAKTDTVTFWIGDEGIRSCSMMIKGNTVSWF